MRGAGAARRGLGQAPRAMSAERQAVGALLFPPIGGSLRAGRRRSLRTEVVCVGAPGPLARERIAVRCGRFGRFSSVRRLERQTLSLADGLFLKARGGGQTAKFAWARAARFRAKRWGGSRTLRRCAASPFLGFALERGASRPGSAQGAQARCAGRSGGFLPNRRGFLVSFRSLLAAAPGPGARS